MATLDAGLSDLLLHEGRLNRLQLARLHAESRRISQPFIAVLRAASILPQQDLARILAGLSDMSLRLQLPEGDDPRWIMQVGLARCMELGIAPLGPDGRGHIQVAISRIEDWHAIAPEMTAILGPVRPVLTLPAEIERHIRVLCAPSLVRAAETTLPASRSLRSLRPSRAGLILAALAAGTVALTAPMLLLMPLLAWVVVSLGATVMLRLLAIGLCLTRRPAPAPSASPPHVTVSLLVPLHREPDIARRLLNRLARLDWPRALLDIIIILEERDHETRDALARQTLPAWIRVVSVPHGDLATKPRAMNHALQHCRGEIVGIYDAEDAHDADQIRKVVARFADAGPDLGCLQGALDYYNPRTNGIARLFTAEYAAWFRVIMPCLQWLRLPMPLGGTTLFMRRQVLHDLGAWDACNVTEDADLGIRISRAGLRTEMLPSTTHEEANCRARPWVRQRSRWIKGHLLTWALHMREPRQLWRDLGGRGFWGYQLILLGAQSQVLLAPLMWTFWAMAFGLPHPMQALLPDEVLKGLLALFLLAEATVMTTAFLGLRRTAHRGLWPWLPLLHLYHMMASLAGWLALHEAFARPFHWAKTSHGHFDQILGQQPAAPPVTTAPGSPFRTPPTRRPREAVLQPPRGPASGLVAGLAESAAIWRQAPLAAPSGVDLHALLNARPALMGPPHRRRSTAWRASADQDQSAL